MSRLLLIGSLVTVVSGLWAADAMAQRDAGAKMRGDVTSFWGPGYHRSGRESFFYRQAVPSTESYRSFSYEPVAIHAGDTVAVKGDNVKVMRGTNVIGTVPNGLEFKVIRVVNGWLGAVVEVEGKSLSGWIWHKNVTVGEKAAGTSPQATPNQAAQAPGYRRFSYEPTEPSSSYGTSARTKQPWLYPKTDPRRFRPY